MGCRGRCKGVIERRASRSVTCLPACVTGSPPHSRSTTLQRLGEAPHALARVEAHRGVLGRGSQADADDQPAAADDVERGELLGDIDGLMQRQQQHAGAERHAFGLGAMRPSVGSGWKYV